MRLEITVRQLAYRHLWLKYVSGFNPAVHCAACLVGGFDRVLVPVGTGRNAGAHVSGPLRLGGRPFAYLCGVTFTGWANNLHIAMRPAEGGVIEHEDKFCIVRAEGVERLAIPPLPDGFIGLGREFTTCRNWQFGWAYLGDTITTQPGLDLKGE